MRSKSGCNILLVLVLSLACLTTISANDGSLEITKSKPDVEVANSNLLTGTVTVLEGKATTQHSKRDYGTPGPVSSYAATSKESPVPNNEAAINEPINDPISGVLGNDSPLEPSQARGMSTNLMPANGRSHSGSSSQQPQVSSEDLPTIIENNRPSQQFVGYSHQVSPQMSQQKTQPQQQQSQTQQPQQTQLTPLENDLSLKPVDVNSTLPFSTARTFDSWTNCVGAQSNKYGTCKNDVECSKNKGRPDGSCMGGFGVCCVMALTCGDKSLENNTFYANPDFPEPSWEARLCEVEVKKKSSKIVQIMIEFEEFELAPPNQEGECVTDVFTVKLQSNRPSPYSLLRLCGQNTGQHMYLDVSQLDEPLLLSIATSGGGYPRRWSIRIVQMDEKNFLLAPPGCLQYYTDTVGHFRSFNLGKNLKNLYYAICFRIDNGYSGIRFTENFFGMNGPFCRRKQHDLGHHNITFGAHPHHLVIPPPGYGRPLPRPRVAYQQQGQLVPAMPQQPLRRFRRQDFSEPVERTQRTHTHEHEAEKHREKEFKNEEYPYQSHGYGYGPPPSSYGHSYGGYNHEYPQYYDHYKKGDYKEELKEGKHHEHEQSKSWWSNGFGWSSSKQDTHPDSKHELHHGGIYEYPQGYSHQGYGQQRYGQYPYSPQHYGPQSYPPPGYGYQSYGPPGYGPPGYGHPGYGGKGYGEYHHKEIDKFGKKYEHLEYKHEKNHHHGKEEKSSWWPSWGSKGGKKDGKKDEKYYQHHEALFPLMRLPEMPHCEPKFCGQSDVITFPPSGDSIAEMCGNRFNRGRGPKIISGSPLVVYVSNRGYTRGAGFDMNYEQVFYIPKPY